MKKFCVYCGQDLDENSKFCHNCGAECYKTDTNNSSVTTSNISNSNINNTNVGYTNKMATIGFVSSIVSYFLCCGFFFLPTLIISCIGLKNANEHDGVGKGMAIAGIVLSVLPIFSFIFSIVVNFIDNDSSDIINGLFSL